MKNQKPCVSIEHGRGHKTPRCPLPQRSAAYFNQTKNQGRRLSSMVNESVVNDPQVAESVASVPLGPSSDIGSSVSRLGMRRVMELSGGLSPSTNGDENVEYGISTNNTQVSDSVVSFPLGASSDISSTLHRLGVRRVMELLGGLSPSTNDDKSAKCRSAEYGISPKKTQEPESVVSVPIGASSDIGSSVSLRGVRRVMEQLGGLSPATSDGESTASCNSSPVEAKVRATSPCDDELSFVSCMSTTPYTPKEQLGRLIAPAGTTSTVRHSESNSVDTKAGKSTQSVYRTESRKPEAENLTPGNTVKKWIVTKGTVVKGVVPRPPRLSLSTGVTMESKACQTEDAPCPCCKYLPPNRITM